MNWSVFPIKDVEVSFFFNSDIILILWKYHYFVSHSPFCHRLFIVFPTANNNTVTLSPLSSRHLIHILERRICVTPVVSRSLSKGFLKWLERWGHWYRQCSRSPSPALLSTCIRSLALFPSRAAPQELLSEPLNAQTWQDALETHLLSCLTSWRKKQLGDLKRSERKRKGIV